VAREWEEKGARSISNGEEHAQSCINSPRGEGGGVELKAKHIVGMNVGGNSLPVFGLKLTSRKESYEWKIELQKKNPDGGTGESKRPRATTKAQELNGHSAQHSSEGSNLPLTDNWLPETDRGGGAQN